MYGQIQQFVEDDSNGDNTAKQRFREFIELEYLGSRCFYYDPNYFDVDGNVTP